MDINQDIGHYLSEWIFFRTFGGVLDITRIYPNGYAPILFWKAVPN